MVTRRSRRGFRVGRRARPPGSWRPFRCPRFEPLEDRRLLAAPSLAAIQNVTLAAGAPLHVALDGYDPDGDPLSWTASLEKENLEGGWLETYIPEGNRSMRISVEGYGEMLFELFEGRAPETTARIIELAQTPREGQPADSGFYDGLIFHRVIEDFMIQGGDPQGDGTGGSGMEFDDEFHPELLHTNAGVLSMAKSFDDTNDSQFFVTGAPTRWLDFNHTVFGFLVEGDQVRQAIASVETDSADKPKQDVRIESVTIEQGEDNAVLMLAAPPGTGGTVEVEVTASDGHGGTARQTFQVTVVEDSQNTYPWLTYIDPQPIRTTAGEPAAFFVEGWDREGDPMFYGAWNRSDWGPFPGEDLQIEIDPATGAGTVVGKEGVVGVHGLLVGVNPFSPDVMLDYRELDPRYFDSEAPGYSQYWDFQFVPVYVTPAPPTGIELLASTDSGLDDGDGLTSFNNAKGRELRFRVSGVAEGALVILYAEGEEVGSATATGDSVVVITDGKYPLQEGVNSIIARQILVDEPVSVGNTRDTVTLTSDFSAPIEIAVDTAPPEFHSSPVTEGSIGNPYFYDVETDAEAEGLVEYRLAVPAPAGMHLDAETGEITWTPQPDQGPTASITVLAKDGAGNEASQAFEIGLSEAPRIGPIPDQQVNEGSELSFQVSAEGGEGDLTFSLDPGAPPTAALEPIAANAALFRWTPEEVDGPGHYAVSVRVTDAAGVSSTRKATITVAEVNRPPVLQPVGDLSVDEGQVIDYVLGLEDPDLPANELTAQLAEGAPAGAEVLREGDSWRFVFRPDELQGGQALPVTIRVSDSAGGAAEQSFTVHVNEVDQPPAFQPVPRQLLAPGERMEVELKASDPDRPAKPRIAYRLADADLPPGVELDDSDPQHVLLRWDVPRDFAGTSVRIKVRAIEVSEGGREGPSTEGVVEAVVFDLREIAFEMPAPAPGPPPVAPPRPAVPGALLQTIVPPVARPPIVPGEGGAEESGAYDDSGPFGMQIGPNIGLGSYDLPILPKRASPSPDDGEPDEPTDEGQGGSTADQQAGRDRATSVDLALESMLRSEEPAG